MFFVMSFLQMSTALGRHASPLRNSVRSRLTWCQRRSRLRSGPILSVLNISLFLWIIETTPNCVGSRRVVIVTDQLTEIPQRTLRTLRRHLSTESPAVQAHHFRGKWCPFRRTDTPLPREVVRPARGSYAFVDNPASDSAPPGPRSTTLRRDAHLSLDKPAAT